MSNYWNSRQLIDTTKYQIVQPEAEGLTLINLNNNDTVQINLMPNSVSETYSPRIIQEASIFGRIRPINFYTGGSSKKIAFSMQLHEDINNDEGSIYKLINKMREMTKPVFNERRVLQEPLIYFQLGNQFSGVGFINLDVAYDKPFRILEDSLGRYALADVSMTITYQEEFEPVFGSLDGDEEVLTSVITVSIEELYNKLNPVLRGDIINDAEDLVKYTNPMAYHITQSFANEKLLGGFLNSVFKNNDYLRLVDELSETEADNLLRRLATGIYLTGADAVDIVDNYNQFSSGHTLLEIPALLQTLNYYMDLSNILNSGLINIIEKPALLRSLSNSIYEYAKDFRKIVDAAINELYTDWPGARYQPDAIITLIYGHLYTRYNITISQANAIYDGLLRVRELAVNMAYIYEALIAAGQ